ncbi:hypothetical protein RL72_01518 [Microbacterium azadirachtae]|uniref:Adhesin domain-containing protein n=1 Tax=Microbacterium azadirachtae TaxID=582680 RepID=A0A0F0KW48_9MICO|nr:DUF4097 family beta strand repeat-containing protein [Microbacterium azadirachtae]KJL25147.1 hypothetical protein RL72_01518 [Microbacterium azadirachtae]
MTNLTPPRPGTDPSGTAHADPDVLTATTEPTGAPNPAPAAGARPPQGALLAITIAAAIIGGGALVVAGGTSAFAAMQQVATGDGADSRSTTADVRGVTTLKIDVGRGAATVRFSDVTDATMSVTGDGGGDWTMRRDGDVLRVDRPNTPFGWWIGSWFGTDPRMTLTLPRELEGELTGDLTLNAGSLTTEGRFETLSTTVNAGSLTVDGGAASVTTRVNAGSAELRLDDVTTADLSLSAGDLNATIGGSQPDLIRLDVSAGTMDVTVPSGRYDLSKDTSAGSLEARIQTDPSSPHRIRSSVSAGSVVIREGS